MAAAKLNQRAVEMIADSTEVGCSTGVPDNPAYGAGATEDEAIANLAVVLRGSSEGFGLDDGLQRWNAPINLWHIELHLADLGYA